MKRVMIVGIGVVLLVVVYLCYRGGQHEGRASGIKNEGGAAGLSKTEVAVIEERTPASSRGHGGSAATTGVFRSRLLAAGFTNWSAEVMRCTNISLGDAKALLGFKSDQLRVPSDGSSAFHPEYTFNLTNGWRCTVVIESSSIKIDAPNALGLFEDSARVSIMMSEVVRH